MKNIDALKKRTAQIVSLLFVPPALTIIIFTYFAFSLESGKNSYVVLYVAYLFGFILPIIMFALLRKKGKIADFDATVKEERIFPFVIGVLFYICGLIVLLYHHVNLITLSFWFCYISNTILVILITRHWKISAHALGVSGPLAAIVYVLGWPGFVFSLLLFLVGWSRLYLKVHTPSQILAGGIMGFSLTYMQIYFIMKYLQDGF